MLANTFKTMKPSDNCKWHFNVSCSSRNLFPFPSDTQGKNKKFFIRNNLDGSWKINLIMREKVQCHYWDVLLYCMRDLNPSSKIAPRSP